MKIFHPMNRARTLMIQGTTSDAGKSTVVAALCRWLLRQGIDVAPFKPQNMALNSAVTAEGGEIGRAQALQAVACGLLPHTDMNPVLLKPVTDQGAQVIIQGKAVTQLNAQSYHHYKPLAQVAVLESHARLAHQYSVIVAEGAGSPAEINLRENDIANMGFAEAVDCPVLLVADIERGGVFAHIVGTLELLSPSERKRIKGFIINRFRGDLALLQPGIHWLEQKTGLPVLGVLPYLHDLLLDAEDALPDKASTNASFHVAIPAWPRISNHTDFDALRLHPAVQVSFVREGHPFPAADLICLPGSKAVAADLSWLRAQGWEYAIQRHLRYGGKVIGLCGGFQMLGTWLHDPLGLEGPPSSTPGLGYFDMETRLDLDKILLQRHGHFSGATCAVSGYEIHAGRSTGSALTHPAFFLEPVHVTSAISAPPSLEPEGSLSQDGQILGTYLHGIFDTPAACSELLAWAGLVTQHKTPDREHQREHDLNRLADIVDQHLDRHALLSILNLPGAARPIFPNSASIPAGG